MLHWGEKRQPWRGLMAEGNPADLVDMETLLPNDYEEERDRVLSPAELRELAEIFARATADYNAAPDGTKYQVIRPLKRESELALWICLGTLCRIGELLMAEWKHVDMVTGTWFIPKANVKGRRKKKQDHYVFLSDFVRRQFVELQRITGQSAWLFPARDNKTHVCVKTISKQVGDRQTRFKQCGKPLAHRRQSDALVLADGVNGKWTPHDMRRTGATMMQQLGIPLEIIDRCQNHVLAGSKVRRHYLHHDYQQEKTEAWNRLGNKIVSILESA
jgi:integrase